MLPLDALISQPPHRLFPNLHVLTAKLRDSRLLLSPSLWVAGLQHLQCLVLSLDDAPSRPPLLPPTLTSLDISASEGEVSVDLDGMPRLGSLSIYLYTPASSSATLLAQRPAAHLTELSLEAPLCISLDFHRLPALQKLSLERCMELADEGSAGTAPLGFTSLSLGCNNGDPALARQVAQLMRRAPIKEVDLDGFAEREHEWGHYTQVDTLPDQVAEALGLLVGLERLYGQFNPPPAAESWRGLQFRQIWGRRHHCLLQLPFPQVTQGRADGGCKAVWRAKALGRASRKCCIGGIVGAAAASALQQWRMQ